MFIVESWNMDVVRHPYSLLDLNLFNTYLSFLFILIFNDLFLLERAIYKKVLKLICFEEILM